jgi:hypothetical protein
MDKDTGTLCIRIYTPSIYSIHYILFNLPMYTLLPVLAIYLRLYHTCSATHISISHKDDAESNALNQDHNMVYCIENML